MSGAMENEERFPEGVQHWKLDAMDPMTHPGSSPNQFMDWAMPQEEDASGWASKSVGSRDHGRGQCIPCKFLFTPRGCRDGLLCDRCHFPHPEMTRSARRKNIRRNRLAALKQEQESPGTGDMPPFGMGYGGPAGGCAGAGNCGGPGFDLGPNQNFGPGPGPCLGPGPGRGFDPGLRPEFGPGPGSTMGPGFGPGLGPARVSGPDAGLGQGPNQRGPFGQHAYQARPAPMDNFQADMGGRRFIEGMANEYRGMAHDFGGPQRNFGARGLSGCSGCSNLATGARHPGMEMSQMGGVGAKGQGGGPDFGHLSSGFGVGGHQVEGNEFPQGGRSRDFGGPRHPLGLPGNDVRGCGANYSHDSGGMVRDFVAVGEGGGFRNSESEARFSNHHLGAGGDGNFARQHDGAGGRDFGSIGEGSRGAGGRAADVGRIGAMGFPAGSGGRPPDFGPFAGFSSAAGTGPSASSGQPGGSARRVNGLTLDVASLFRDVANMTGEPQPGPGTDSYADGRRWWDDRPGLQDNSQDLPQGGVDLWMAAQSRGGSKGSAMRCGGKGGFGDGGYGGTYMGGDMGKQGGKGMSHHGMGGEDWREGPSQVGGFGEQPSIPEEYPRGFEGDHEDSQIYSIDRHVMNTFIHMRVTDEEEADMGNLQRRNRVSKTCKF